NLSPGNPSPGQTFGLTAVVTDSSGARDTNFNGMVSVTLASGPDGTTLGGTVTVPAVAGVATFSDLKLNSAGNYILQVAGNGPMPTTKSISVGTPKPTPSTPTPTPSTPTTTPATPPPTPSTPTPTPSTPTPTPSTPPTITGERIVLTFLKHNKKGKPIGKPVVSFVFQFSTAMDPGTTGTASNYQVNW